MAGHPEIRVAYLFGSAAAGRAGPLSDVDVGLVLGATGRDLGFRVADAVRIDLARALGTDALDVVALDGASPLLRHEVVCRGRPVFIRDEEARVEFHARALRDYFDTAPLRAARHAALRERLASGTFGRPREAT
ncbi:MAG: nucleotidyltransferase domain-containing protein [Planctomycetes bacterium]|nr:nucleotidyltransferase domain-containing protein [Planctomycetota bacterium]